MINKKILLVLAILGLLLTVTACSRDIEDVKDDTLIDQKVTIRGYVGESVKIGAFSGYTLHDDTGSIAVVTDDLPKDGSRVTVRGTLKKLFVYYIEVE